MQDASKTITIEVEEYKKMLLDAHDATRYCVENYKLRDEIKQLQKQLKELGYDPNS